MLPLSGAHAGLGQALLQASEMALFETNATDIRLVVRDTGEPGGAGAASQELVAEGVKLILGPIFAADVAQAAPPARTAQVPMISFSTDRAVAGNGVYVMGILPQLQVDRVVRFAASRGAKRVAALLPDSPFGRAVAGQLPQSALASGGALSVVEFYPPGTTDFSSYVQRLAEAKDSFDAVLMPEGGDAARQAVPLLAYFGVDRNVTRLLGTQLWNDPALMREPSLAGGWFAAPASEAWAAFASRYQADYGGAPPRIASLAYDATALAAALARAPARSGAAGGNASGGGSVVGPAAAAAPTGASAGSPFSADTLTTPDGFAGIDGIFRFRADGGVERGLAVYEIGNGSANIIDPAPQSFAPPGA
jgi:ABC-type branched-subunit amino acid transport system substrate-binding protein